MPKANPLAQISKRLASLEVKNVKVTEELKALIQMVEIELKKQEAAPVAVKAAPAKKPTKPAVKSASTTSARTIATPKKMGRPAKK
jgi:hypothetical protein